MVFGYVLLEYVFILGKLLVGKVLVVVVDCVMVWEFIVVVLVECIVFGELLCDLLELCLLLFLGILGWYLDNGEEVFYYEVLCY